MKFISFFLSFNLIAGNVSSVCIKDLQRLLDAPKEERINLYLLSKSMFRNRWADLDLRPFINNDEHQVWKAVDRRGQTVTIVKTYDGSPLNNKLEYPLNPTVNLVQREYIYSRLAEKYNFDIVAHTEVGLTKTGNLVTMQEFLKKPWVEVSEIYPYREKKNSPRLMAMADRFKSEDIGEIIALDYIFGSYDRNMGNIFFNQETGRLKLIDDEMILNRRKDVAAQSNAHESMFRHRLKEPFPKSVVDKVLAINTYDFLQELEKHDIHPHAIKHAKNRLLKMKKAFREGDIEMNPWALELQNTFGVFKQLGLIFIISTGGYVVHNYEDLKEQIIENRKKREEEN